VNNLKRTMNRPLSGLKICLV